MVFGLSSGQFLVEQFMTCAKKGKINMDQLITLPSLTSRITCIQYLEQFSQLALCTSKGEFVSYDFIKREPYLKVSFQNEAIT